MWHARPRARAGAWHDGPVGTDPKLRRRPADGPVVVVAMGIERWALGGPAEVTGVGPTRAAAAARDLAARLPPGVPVALTGLCGALDPLEPGTAVVADAVGALGDAPQPLAGAEQVRAACAAAWPGPVAQGWLLSVDQVVRGRRRSALRATGAVAVDMETAAWAEHLGSGRPLAVVRVVADGPGAGMVRGGLVGLRQLRRLRPVLLRWAEEVAGRPSAGR